ncbi:MAG: PKD domain-containing protein, partial [Bacteroidia bacterium]
AVLFDSIGNHNVVLKIITKKGCTDSVKKTITINPVPIVSFTVNNYCPYDTIKVNSSSTVARGTIKNNTWRIDGVYNSKLAGIVVPPIKEGNYTINLIVQSDSLCMDSLQKPFTVYPGIIIKSLFSKECESDTMNYSDVSIQGNAKIAGRVMSNMAGWFPDSTASFPVNSKGIFNYRVHIGTTNGCDYIKDSVYEVLERPKADFSSNSPCNDNFVTFIDKSLAGSKATITSTQWFENNLPISSASSFSKRFATSGLKSIRLLVQNSFGCSDSVKIPTIISPLNYADFNFKDACPDDTVKVDFIGFTGSNSITTYNLKWGDGKTANSLPASNIYKTSGNYNIQLSISTLPGCTYDTFKTIKIFSKPKSDFDFYPQYPDVKNPAVTLTDKSSGALKWFYTFGDGNSSLVQNPIYSYKDSGEYFIRQLVENKFGCKDSSSKRVYVNFILFTHIPNAFSPGTDDINPLFAPSGLGIKDYKLTIFNRWGEKIYDPGWGRNAWDGIYKNELVQSGFYPYYIEIIDFGNIRHSYHGVVSVIR